MIPLYPTCGSTVVTNLNGLCYSILLVRENLLVALTHGLHGYVDTFAKRQASQAAQKLCIIIGTANYSKLNIGFPGILLTIFAISPMQVKRSTPLRRESPPSSEDVRAGIRDRTNTDNLFRARAENCRSEKLDERRIIDLVRTKRLGTYGACIA
jgi:hypothetical protein